jgi:hypothetical protein
MGITAIGSRRVVAGLDYDIMRSILLEIGNKYTDEREKQFYLQG